MLDFIRIQNYKSIKDATFNLKDVNLLIGANNSGKTNFMKALEFFGNMYNGKLDMQNIERHFYGFNGSNEMSFTFVSNKNGFTNFFKIVLKIIGTELFFIEVDGYKIENEISKFDYDIKNLDELSNNLDQYNFHSRWLNHNLIKPKTKVFSSRILESLTATILGISYNFRANNDDFHYINFDKYTSSPLITFKNNYPYKFCSDIWVEIMSIFSNISIYKPNISTLLQPGQISNDSFVKVDASNLVSFLDEMNNNYSDNYEKINTELARCVGEITKVTTPTVKGLVDEKETVLGKKLRFLDKNKRLFWSDEVSDGVLYFTALLCILNQPNPPKLLLLEEPETGIHPVRIREIVDYIFDLAQEKGIQIILTSHNVNLVEEFKDFPRNIFVFSKSDGATNVKNLKTDIIEIDDIEREKMGFPKTNYLENLSDSWMVGLIDGIPA